MAAPEPFEAFEDTQPTEEIALACAKEEKALREFRLQEEKALREKALSLKRERDKAMAFLQLSRSEKREYIKHTPLTQLDREKALREMVWPEEASREETPPETASCEQAEDGAASSSQAPATAKKRPRKAITRSEVALRAEEKAAAPRAEEKVAAAEEENSASAEDDASPCWWSLFALNE